MKYTENYHLPQWVKTDRIMMDDFNQMCADIDSGINTAQAAAEDAKTEALKLPYVIGTYVGDGKMIGDPQDINLGFRPSFVIVSGQEQKFGGGSGADLFFIATSATAFTTLFAITDSGFRVFGGSNEYPQLNQFERVYDYIAFR